MPRYLNPTMSTTMKTALRCALVAAAASVLLLAGCASPPADTTGLALPDQLLRHASPTAAVSLTVDPPQVRVGDTIALQMASALQGYLYVLQVGTDGKASSVVFPNAMDGANFLPGGGAIATLPRANWRLTARGPAGVGYFVAVVADKPQDLTALAAQVKTGRVVVEGPYGAAMATLREVAP